MSLSGWAASLLGSSIPVEQRRALARLLQKYGALQEECTTSTGWRFPFTNKAYHFVIEARSLGFDAGHSIDVAWVKGSREMWSTLEEIARMPDPIPRRDFF